MAEQPNSIIPWRGPRDRSGVHCHGGRRLSKAPAGRAKHPRGAVRRCRKLRFQLLCAHRSGRRSIDRLAERGLRYTGFHTTAMCSTTRAALLTGRNHHSVGVGCLANFDSGFPGYRGKIAKEAGTLAEMLRPHGYRSYMVGKWHVTPLTEAGATGPFDGWPLGRGFDRFYGFMDAETDQYSPELVLDNSSIDPPGTFESGYHLTADLVDQSIRFLAGHAAGAARDAPTAAVVARGSARATRPIRLRSRSSGATTRESSRKAGTPSVCAASSARRRWVSCHNRRALAVAQ